MFNSLKLAAKLVCSNNTRICSGRFHFCRTYKTWYHSYFNGRFQPVLQVEKLIEDQKNILNSIEKRGMKNIEESEVLFSKIQTLYSDGKKYNENIAQKEKEREENRSKVQSLVLSQKKNGKDDISIQNEIDALRSNGKKIREELKGFRNSFKEVNDELISIVLQLPNVLDEETPSSAFKYLKEYCHQAERNFWLNPKNLQNEKISDVGPNTKYIVGNGSWAEYQLMRLAHEYLLEKKYVEISNVDFVKRIIVEGTGLNPNQFLLLKEDKRRNSLAHATYLVGGGTFPAFLALFAQSLIPQGEKFPKRYFAIGRGYGRSASKCKDGIYDPYQETRVEAFVACRDEFEQKDEFEKLQEDMADFYTSIFDFKVQSGLLPANLLANYERKKVQFFGENKENEDGKVELKVLGDVSTVGDFVSKRLLCCYVGELQTPKFLHMISANFLNLTKFLESSNSKLGKKI